MLNVRFLNESLFFSSFSTSVIIPLPLPLLWFLLFTIRSQLLILLGKLCIWWVIFSCCFNIFSLPFNILSTMDGSLCILPTWSSLSFWMYRLIFFLRGVFSHYFNDFSDSLYSLWYLLYLCVGASSGVLHFSKALFLFSSFFSPYALHIAGPVSTYP